MAKTEIKTRPTDASVQEFLNSIADVRRRADGFRALEMFERISGEKPVMWGTAIIGFGSRILKYPNGRELDWPIIGFSPRKQNMSLYVICNSKKQPELLQKLGKHASSVSCLYIKKLSDVDDKVLEAVIKDAYEYTKEKTAAA